jgi:hypothetical protein
MKANDQSVYTPLDEKFLQGISATGEPPERKILVPQGLPPSHQIKQHWRHLFDYLEKVSKG